MRERRRGVLSADFEGDGEARGVGEVGEGARAGQSADCFFFLLLLLLLCRPSRQSAGVTSLLDLLNPGQEGDY